MLNIVLLLLVVAAAALSFARFGWNSFLSLGALGTAIYSIPAIIGYYSPVHISYGAPGVFQSATSASISIYILVWMMFIFLLMIFPRIPVDKPAGAQVKLGQLWAASVIAVAGFFYLVISWGPLFFLEPRGAVEEGAVVTLWRWSLLFGLLASVAVRSTGHLAVHTILLVVYFLMGDRTIPAIAVGAVLIFYSLNQEKIKPVPSFSTVLLVGLSFVFLLYGKLVYLAVKLSDIDIILRLADRNFIAAQLSSFEPMVTYNFLEYIIAHDVVLPVDEFFLAIFGNVLLVPSAFGVETSFFNKHLTAMMPYRISFGLAGSYYASGFAFMGILGVMILAVIFLGGLYVMNRCAATQKGLVRITLVILGSTFAVYAHRNGLDNLLSFARQIFIMGVFLNSVASIVRLLKFKGKRYPA
ncbi:hypothetical protein ABIE65_005409 [Constrictibacter sp. MBR-5]|jgi:hypothetical protein